ncbi:MAG: polysaccharide deacetylase family protein [Methylocystaceae bacterium]
MQIIHHHKGKLILLAILLLGWLAKGQLHHLGPEIGSAETELAKYFYLIESSFDPQLITRVPVGDSKLVALTFDDGPDPVYTSQVLNILKEYRIKATFFVVGRSVLDHPELIRQEVAAGNEVENHTYTHPNLNQDSNTKTTQEISEGEAAITSVTHKKPHYFRPPRGLFTKETIDVAADKGYKVVLWSICVEHERSKTPVDMANRVIKAARPGTIILAHDGRLNRSRTMAALPLIIEGYQRKGYRFVTLDEMVKKERL